MSSQLSRGSSERLAEFGQIDIYVFDQLLRGQINSSMRILDAGCGAGRNSEYLMRCGTQIYGVDSDPNQISRIRDVASEAAPGLSPDHFRVARLDDLPFPDAYFDAVICNAVLHFSNDTAEFENAVAEIWRVLRSGGVFFARLASTIGHEGRLTHLHDRWYRLPDGTDRFLVDADYLLSVSSSLGAEQLDPLKTTVVQDMRSMTTWVLRKK
jgi:SAM-dependent methyltransferase